MLFNNLAFLPGLTFVSRDLIFSQKVYGNPALPTFLLTKAKNALRLPK